MTDDKQEYKRTPKSIWEAVYDGDVEIARDGFLDAISANYTSGFMASLRNKKPDNPRSIAQQLGWADRENGILPPDEFRCGGCGSLLSEGQFRTRHCGCRFE